MDRDRTSPDDIANLGRIIAKAINAGELKLVIPSPLGQKALDELSTDESAVDYIIQTPELSGP